MARIEMTYISQYFSRGTTYTRAELKQRFSIVDSTINTGVFQPKGYASIWLFVTKQKTADRTQYQDRLEANHLYWQGQTSGRTDKLIQNHEINKLELLLFYRTHKTEHPGAGFRYEGQFCYRSHTGNNPTSFILVRATEATEIFPVHLPAREPTRSFDESPRFANLYEVATDMCLLPSISFADLRTRLFPLDLFPSAVINDINESAIDVIGEPALSEEGDNVVINQDVLSQVIATWKD